MHEVCYSHIGLYNGMTKASQSLQINEPIFKMTNQLIYMILDTSSMRIHHRAFIHLQAIIMSDCNI